MATDRKIYVAGDQMSPAVTRTDGPGAIPYEICVALPLDWGSAPSTIFEVPRPVLDGNLYLGSRQEPREFKLGFVGKLTGSYSASLAEREKDWARSKLVKRFAPRGNPIVVLVRSESGTVRERVLTAKATAYPSWSVSENLVGQVRDDPHFFAEVPLRASFPWWLDSTAGSMYLSGTANLNTAGASVVLTNDGDMDTGIQVAFKANAAWTGSTVVDFSVTYNATLTTMRASLALSSSTWTVFDFWCTDPLAPPKFVSGAADLFNLTGLSSVRSSVTVWPTRPFVAQTGTITVSANTTATSGNGTFSARVRRSWIDP